MAARWGSTVLCKTCPHRQRCDYRLPLGQPPNPPCPDGWAEGSVPAHMIPGPQYKPPSGIGKHNVTEGWSESKRRQAWNYRHRHFCLACACQGKHTPISNHTTTWLCRRHARRFRTWREATGRVPIPKVSKSQKAEAGERRRQAITKALTLGPLSLREIATALDFSYEGARYHLKVMQRRHLVEQIDQRRGQSWVAWQLIP